MKVWVLEYDIQGYYNDHYRVFQFEDDALAEKDKFNSEQICDCCIAHVIEVEVE